MSAGGRAVPAAWSRLEGLIAGFGDRIEGPSSTSVLTVKQVHGRRVAAAEEVRAASDAIEADGIVVTRPGEVAAVKTADCVPILMVAESSSRERWAAAVHAGWRGTLAGIAAEAVGAAKRAGHDPSRLRAALGPSIGGCCLEVGEEVAERFRAAGLEVIERRPRPYLDLRAINRALLLDAGVAADRIEDCGPCTRCRSDLYHSYRAEPDRHGRQLSWIGWAARAA